MGNTLGAKRADDAPCCTHSVRHYSGPMQFMRSRKGTNLNYGEQFNGKCPPYRLVASACVIAWHGLHILPLNHVTPIQQSATLQTLGTLHSGWIMAIPFVSGSDLHYLAK